jgi:hypothetical protein
MPFSANTPAYSGRPSFVSQSVISCITAHARLNFGLVDPLDGRFYPIDRAARNRPERSAAGGLQATAAGRAPPWAVHVLGSVYVHHHPLEEGRTIMATSVERMKGLRERERRGLRSFTVPVSEDDLRVMAKHGYEGALSTDHEQQAQTVSRFITDALAARRAGKGVKAVATSFQ